MSAPLLGRRLSPGLSAGPAWIFKPQVASLENYQSGNPTDELKKFEAAVQSTDADLRELEEKSRQESPEQVEIISTHRMLLQDPEWHDQIKAQIQAGQPALAAVQKVTEEFSAMMAALEDEYLRERAQDIKDIGHRLALSLVGEKPHPLLPETGEYILVAQDLTPSQFASLDKKRVLGLVTEVGGVTAHTAIMARLYEIPALSGIERAIERIKNHDWLFLQADKSDLYINPPESEKAGFLKAVEKYRQLKLQLLELKDQKSETKDGIAVQLEANIGQTTDLELVHKYNAEGIGLFRTEFLFFDRTKAPTEKEQHDIYLEAATSVSPHPVVIRTFDIGADKQVPYLKWPHEDNPFLGLRALRYCLKEPALFHVQLRALLKASSKKPLSIMFPMVSSLEELQAARVHLDQCEKEVRKEGLNPQYRLGIMIEVPAAALIANQLAPHVDFFSIGTNDLIQYVCAVDRMNESVAHLYESFHPGVLNLIAQVIEAGRKHSVEVAMCGEMAADLELIPVLLGMGLRVFSQSPATVLRSKHLIRGLDIKACENLWGRVRELGSAKEIQKLCSEFKASIGH